MLNIIKVILQNHDPLWKPTCPTLERSMKSGSPSSSAATEPLDDQRLLTYRQFSRMSNPRTVLSPLNILQCVHFPTFHQAFTVECLGLVEHSYPVVALQQRAPQRSALSTNQPSSPTAPNRFRCNTYAIPNTASLGS